MKSGRLLLALVTITVGQHAFAAERACMLEGTLSVAGQRIPTKDCMQAVPGESEERFRQSCEQLAQAAATLGGARPTVNYISRCPLPAQGICSNFMRSGRSAYYYKRPASHLARLPKSCAFSGGTWKASE